MDILYICVKLADEAREVAVLEEGGEEISGELRRLPHHEGGPVIVPRYDVIGGGILDEHVGFDQERRRSWLPRGRGGCDGLPHWIQLNIEEKERKKKKKESEESKHRIENLGGEEKKGS